MTALVARSPLQSLGMNRAQAQPNNGRRRSARNAFEDDKNEDAPPAKRSKGDVAAKSASSQSGADATAAGGVKARANGTTTGKKTKKCE